MLSNEILRFVGEIEIDNTTGGHQWDYDSLFLKTDFLWILG